MKRRLVCLFAIGLAVIGLTSCTRNAEVDKETFVVALASGPANLDPRFATDAAGHRLSGLLFSSIVRTGPELAIIGEAASDWYYKDLTYTFNLRPGLVFSNGRALTGEDIEFSFKEFMAPKSPFASAFKAIKSIEAKYDSSARQVKVQLHQFSASLLADLGSLKILPKKEIEEAGDDFGKRLIGTGPFAFESMNANEIRLKAKENHAYSTPKIKSLLFKIIRDDNTRYLKTLKGEIDLAQQELPPNKISELEKNSSLEVFKYPGLSMTYLLLNLEDPLLKSLDVRRAISLAINRDEIIKYKLDDLATPATSILTPINPYFNKSLTPLAHDPARAKEWLAKLGAAGKEIVLKTSNTQSAVENGKVIANQLQAAGLNVKMQSFEWGTYYSDVQKGNFQLATMRWVGTNDPDIYRSSLHSAELPPTGRNRGRYHNIEFDKLTEQGLRIANEKTRIDHYQTIQKIVYDDLPIIPLWYDTEVAVINRRVKGYRPPKNGDFSSLTQVHKE